MHVLHSTGVADPASWESAVWDSPSFLIQPYAASPHITKGGKENVVLLLVPPFLSCVLLSTRVCVFSLPLIRNTSLFFKTKLRGNGGWLRSLWVNGKVRHIDSKVKLEGDSGRLLYNRAEQASCHRMPSAKDHHLPLCPWPAGVSCRLRHSEFRTAPFPSSVALLHKPSWGTPLPESLSSSGVPGKFPTVLESHFFTCGGGDSDETSQMCYRLWKMASMQNAHGRGWQVTAPNKR